MEEALYDIDSVRFTYVHLPPFVDEINENGKIVLDGFMPPMIKALAHWMKFTPIFIPESERVFGTFRNGTWNGMFGMLLRNEADIMMSPVLPEADFVSHAVYTNPVAIEKFAMLATKKSEEAGFFLLFNVFQIQVWIGILFCLCLVPAIAATVYCRIANLSSVKWFRVVMEYIWVLYSYMMHQEVNPKWNLWGRSSGMLSWVMPMLMMFWVVGVAFLVMNVFSSGLFAMLTVVKRVPTVDTMMDLVKKKHIKATSTIGIDLDVALQDSGMPVFDQLWERVEPNLIPDDEYFADQMLTETEEGKLSLIHGYLVLQSVLDNRFKTKTQCNFHMASETFYTFPLVCSMKKTLPKSFMEKFNYGLTRLIDADIPGKWIKQVVQGSDLCLAYFENSLKPLSIKNLYGVLALFGTGTAIALLTLLLEMLLHKKNQQKKNKKWKKHRKMHF